ncbi:MAG: hypothetical protein HQ511_07715 [Rhodospirillales bacterium]|nr:hypothetical protein [Rhodospirillales bacterium]
MTTVTELHNKRASGFSPDSIEWIHLEGGPNFDYPIDYWIAILGAQPEAGRIDLLAKWEPNAYCHYHRHVCETTSLVLEGEHHIVETTATETIHKTRTRGHYAKNPPGDLHMEYAGPEGSVLLFSLQADDGRLFEVLDRDDNVLVTATIESLLSGELG